MMEVSSLLELRGYVQLFIKRFGLLEQTVTPCGYSLSLSQVFALQELEKATLTLTELAEKLQLERSSVSRLVDQLVKGGFVHREPNEQNRREVKLSLSDKGERSIINVREQSIRYYSTLLDEVSEEERRQVVAGFRIFADALLKAKQRDFELGSKTSMSGAK
ncbi:MarR family winged helix-turn-helix transcriptional regulator [Paenibacillus tarimensis]